MGGRRGGRPRYTDAEAATDSHPEGTPHPSPRPAAGPSAAKPSDPPMPPSTPQPALVTKPQPVSILKTTSVQTQNPLPVPVTKPQPAATASPSAAAPPANRPTATAVPPANPPVTAQPATLQAQGTPAATLGPQFVPLTAPQQQAPVPRQDTIPAATRVVPFWEKPAPSQQPEGNAQKQTDSQARSVPPPKLFYNPDWAKPATATPSPPIAPKVTPPVAPPKPSQGAVYTRKKAASTPWEDAGHYALNASILSGRFDDLRIVAFSGRVSSGRVGATRALYANSTIVMQILPNLFQDERIKEVHDVEKTSICSTDYDYDEDSDLDDYEPDDSETEQGEDTPALHGPKSEAGKTDHVPPGKVKSGPPQPTVTSPSGRAPTEDDKTTVCTSDNTGASSKPDPAASERTTSPTTADVSSGAPGNASVKPGQEHEPKPVVSTKLKASVKHRESDVRGALSSRPAVNGQRTFVSTDIAYRTWRAVVFYAYTRRVAFAPLRSQGLPFAPIDDESDPSQLPICSPKSMYRLAIKYGNAELEQLAGSDIASKLSTQNVLAELFSRFTSRHPQIQEMELDFALAHLKHPDITVRLPAYIDRFARGELRECADTFGRLIHKLACAATAPGALAGGASASANACPRGCAMATIQHRCGMCGVTFN